MNDTSDQIRLSVNLSPEIADALGKYISEQDVTATEAVRRAISLLAFFKDETKQGTKVLLAKQGEMREVVLEGSIF